MTLVRCAASDVIGGLDGRREERGGDGPRPAGRGPRGARARHRRGRGRHVRLRRGRAADDRGQPEELPLRDRRRSRRQSLVHGAIPDRIGRITPAGVVTEFPSGSPTAARPGHRRGARRRPLVHRGRGNRIGRITPTGTSPSSPPASPARAIPACITAGPGRQPLVHRDRRQPDRADHHGRRGHRVLVPASASQRARDRSRPGPDGNLWFTESLGNRIGRITTAGVMTEFPRHRPGSRPSGIVAGPDGNLWFTEQAQESAASPRPE